MSAKVMGAVFDLEIPQNQKLVMLALGDHADHSGNNIYPGIALLSKKTGYSERSIQRILRQLVKTGYLIPAGYQSGGRTHTAHWQIPLEDGKIVPLKKDAKMSPFIKGRHPKQKRVPNEARKGDTAMSPEPSLTTKKQPSELVVKDPAQNVQIFEEEFRPLKDDQERNQLVTFERTFSVEWVTYAIWQAAQSKKNREEGLNSPIAYIKGILDNWKENGLPEKKKLKKPLSSHPIGRQVWIDLTAGQYSGGFL